MRFILMVGATKYSEAGLYDSSKNSRGMIEFRELLAKTGVLLNAEVIQPSSSGIKITYDKRSEEPELLSGPFSVDQALIAEYFLIDVETEKEALNWALQMPVQNASIDIRRIEEKTTINMNLSLGFMEEDLHHQLNMFRGSK